MEGQFKAYEDYFAGKDIVHELPFKASKEIADYLFQQEQKLQFESRTKVSANVSFQELCDMFITGNLKNIIETISAVILFFKAAMPSNQTSSNDEQNSVEPNHVNRPSSYMLSIKIDGDEINLVNASPEEVEKYITMYYEKVYKE